MNRRTLLRAAGAGLAAAPGFPLVARGPATDPVIKLGLVTYNWGKNWDLGRLLKECEAAGYEGVELRSTHAHKVEPDLSKAQRAEVKKRFADSPVQCFGLGTACEYHSPDPAVLKKNIEETKAFVDLCHDVGGSGIKVRPNGLPQDVPVEKTLEQIGRALDEVAAYGRDHGAQIRTEVHGRGTSEIPNFIKIMKLSRHENSTVCWNCNQADLAGAGLRENFLALRDRVSTIHLHDLRNEEGYPWKEFFDLLRETKFSGWTLVEEGKIPEDIPGAMREVKTLWDSMTEDW